MPPRATFALLIVLTYPLFFHHLGTRDLWSSHEARAAQNAQMILDTGDWLLPRLFDGRAEMQKPPLYYWLVAGIAWLRGGTVDAWAVRLPSALAAVGGMLGVYFLAWRRGRPMAGLLAAVILGTLLHYTWLARVGRIDMPLTFCVSASLACFYLSRDREGAVMTARFWWLLAVYIFTAAAILLKGPVGLVLPTLVIASYLLVERISRTVSPCHPVTVSRLGLWWGFPLVALLTLPWFLWANYKTDGEFFRVFFYYHNFQRGFGGAEELETHAWWFYGFRLLADLLPWSLLLPVAVMLLVRKGYWWKDSEARLGCIWLVVMLLFFSCMSFKRADYLLPAYPGAALLLGCVGERWLKALTKIGEPGCVSARSSRGADPGAPGLARRVRNSLLGVAAAFSVGWYVYVDYVLPKQESTREHRRFAAEIRRRVPQPGLVLLFRTESHPLVFHLGRPFNRIMEWENIDIWACRPMPMYVVMPADVAERWREELDAGELYPVLTNSDLAGGPHVEPLVLFCTRPYNSGQSRRAGSGQINPLDCWPLTTDHWPLFDYWPLTTHHWPLLMFNWQRLPIANSPISAVLPAHEVEKQLPSVLDGLLSQLRRLNREYEIIVVDDGSSDNTRTVAQHLAGQNSFIHCLHPDKPQGYGAALRTGLAAARYPLVLTMPADGSYQAEDLPRLLGVIDQVDIVCGHRKRKGEIKKWFSKWLLHTVFGVWLQDLDCQLRLYRRSIFARIPIQSKGRFADVEILAKANFLSCLMTEVEVGWQPTSPPTMKETSVWSDALRVFREPNFGPAKLESAAV